MASRSTPLLLFAALAGGCGTVPPARPSRAQVEQVLQTAALQVRRCYRMPRVSFGGRHIVTRLRVRLTPEGQLADLPVVLMQDGVTPTNQLYARPMAEAAIQAVISCAPLRLPPSLYQGGWSDFDLTFSLARAA
jgi:hypothetical protein